MTTLGSAEKNNRNYQLDFLKLFFSLMVFAAHTVYLTPNSFEGQTIFNVMGYVSVNFFFTVSGLLMINSANKDHIENRISESNKIGEQSLAFVFHKVKKLIMQYWVALTISIITYMIAYREFFSVIVKSIPEIMMVQSSVYFWSSNGPTWYMSALFTAMIPLSYLLIKNRDSYINVIAPTLSILLYGYLFASQPFASNTFNGITMYSFVRAVCCLCSGAFSWKINLWLKRKGSKSMVRKIITIAEILCYSILFISIFHFSSSGMIYSVMLLLPICIGITFSQTSYISELFKCKIFKYSAQLSLAVFLNHNAGKRLVMVLFPDWSFDKKLFGMILFTVVCIIVYFTAIYFIQYIYIYIYTKRKPEIKEQR